MSSKSTYAAALLALGVASGCAQRGPVAAPTGSAGALPTEQSEEAPPSSSPVSLGAAPKALPDPAPSCTSPGPLPPQTSCPTALTDLADALEQSEPSAIDSKLAPLEACSEVAPGVIRALRAEANPACGDVLVQDVVGEGEDATDGSESTPVASALREILVAQGLGARLRRAIQAPPAAPSSGSKAELNAYFAQELFPWAEAQASAIVEITLRGKKLRGYARGIVAVEAAMADMRFVEMARAVPIPAEMQGDQELSDVYYASLDEALEPRKARGRNAALVGFNDFSRSGVIESPRLAMARELLSHVYGGRRVNALDPLLLPDAPVPAAGPDVAEAATPSEASNQRELSRLAALLPTPYLRQVVPPRSVTAAVMTSGLQMGLDRGMVDQLSTSKDPLVLELLGRALLRRGQRYFLAADFQAASAILDQAKNSSPPPDAASRIALLHSLSVALMAGPTNAAELIAQGPRFAETLGNQTELKALAGAGGPMAGRAGFNSAYLRELVAPEGAPDYYKELAVDYAKAAARLQGPQRALAQERAEAARATSRAVAELLNR